MGAHVVVILVFWSRLHPLFKQQLMMRLVMVPVLFVAVSFLPKVDWLGHLGGLLGGLAVGAILFAEKAEDALQMRLRIGGGVGLAVLVVVPILVIYLTNRGSCS
jgi:membrane associated rhomboid family serine protease